MFTCSRSKQGLCYSYTALRVICLFLARFLDERLDEIARRLLVNLALSIVVWFAVVFDLILHQLKSLRGNYG